MNDSAPRDLLDAARRRLTPKQRRFVSLYSEDLDARSAAEGAGYAPGAGARMLNGPGYHNVKEVVESELQERAEESKLRASYVRDYIHDVLELCPTDYFELADSGDWCIDPASFRELPKSIKRLVVGLTLKHTRSGPIFTVEFVSKTQALTLAARYTLTQKAELTVAPQLPWWEIAAGDEIDPIEEAIREVECGPAAAEVPVPPGEDDVAVDEAVSG